MLNLPELGERATIGEVYNGAMQVETEQEAADYLDHLVQWEMKYRGASKKSATELHLHNIGYYAGYYDDETMKRIYKLYRTNHPILGNLSF